jgi:hypothetical protein
MRHGVLWSWMSMVPLKRLCPQVMEDLLQNAATQACVKAAATLRVRLQTLLSRQGAKATQRRFA